MKKILCIGDSLSLPGHLNRYEDTWLFKLKDTFPEYDFISFFKRQLTSNILTTNGGGINGIDKWPKGADCLEAFMPDIAIIQLGIVDCAPRLLYSFERRLLGKVPVWLRSSYISAVKFFRKRNNNSTLLPYNEFKKKWLNYINRAQATNTKIIIVSISIPDDRMIAKNPNIISNIKLYNSFFLEMATKYSFVETTEPLKKNHSKEVIYEDGYHPNKIGHEIIFRRIKALISQLVDKHV